MTIFLCQIQKWKLLALSAKYWYERRYELLNINVTYWMFDYFIMLINAIRENCLFTTVGGNFSQRRLFNPTIKHVSCNSVQHKNFEPIIKPDKCQWFWLAQMNNFTFHIKLFEKCTRHNGRVNLFLTCPQTNSTHLGRAQECYVESCLQFTDIPIVHSCRVQG